MSAVLKFRFIANACGISSGKNGTKILCDPWLIDGVFEGSWCHFHPLKTTMKDFDSVDAIYISHLHPDHFDDRHFNFDKEKPIIILDHGPNFLMKKLLSLGYTNLIKIKDHETVAFKEFELTMFAPFTKHNFHEATVGNLIDSALLISCDGVRALNANDNTLSIEAAKRINERFGKIDLAMLNYNAAGPYPSCFDNLSESEKYSESERILRRNFDHVKTICCSLKPQFLMPFAGAYVLGGENAYKNKYLGTSTWDACAKYLLKEGIGSTKVVLMNEGNEVDVSNGELNEPYYEIDPKLTQKYIDDVLAKIVYPYQRGPMPDRKLLIEDLKDASGRMYLRMAKFGIKPKFSVSIKVFDEEYFIYPEFKRAILGAGSVLEEKMTCSLDERLLRNILDKKSHWNNAEIGAHISFIRIPNEYDPDLHMGLQFLHL